MHPAFRHAPHVLRDSSSGALQMDGGYVFLRLNTEHVIVCMLGLPDIYRDWWRRAGGQLPAFSAAAWSGRWWDGVPDSVETPWISLLFLQPHEFGLWGIPGGPCGSLAAEVSVSELFTPTGRLAVCLLAVGQRAGGSMQVLHRISSIPDCLSRSMVGSCDYHAFSMHVCLP